MLAFLSFSDPTRPLGGQSAIVKSAMKRGKVVCRGCAETYQSPETSNGGRHSEHNSVTDMESPSRNAGHENENTSLNSHGAVMTSNAYTTPLALVSAKSVRAQEGSAQWSLSQHRWELI